MSHPVKTQQQVKQPELPTEELGTQTDTHTQKQGKPKWAKLSTLLLPKPISPGGGEERGSVFKGVLKPFHPLSFLQLHAYQQESEQDGGNTGNFPE